MHTVSTMRVRGYTRKRSGHFKIGADRRFRHKVDIEVPPRGLGRRLLVMIAWCRDNAGEGSWAHHGTMKIERAAGRPADFARFYFKDHSVARAFAEEFAGE